MPRTRGTRIKRDLPTHQSHLFGWCLPGDGNHDKCIQGFFSELTGVTYACSCTCHGVSDAESNL